MLLLSSILTKQGKKMTLYFGYLQKDKKKILLVPQDCLLLNKYISFPSAQAFFLLWKGLKWTYRTQSFIAKNISFTDLTLLFLSTQHSTTPYCNFTVPALFIINNSLVTIKSFSDSLFYENYFKRPVLIKWEFNTYLYRSLFLL